MRFGDGGHFDTYPLALSPYFGEMVARRAHKVWHTLGRPRRFELCEIGAGNGQLCLDTLSFLAGRTTEEWRTFARACSYRIVEKSPALRRRQAALLGPLAQQVSWTALDLSRRRHVEAFGKAGYVVANEVLDCLAHHKVVLGREGDYRVAFVGALRPQPGGTKRDAPLEPQSFLTRREMDEALAAGGQLQFREILLPLAAVRGLGAFLARHYPAQEVRRRGPRLPWTYFACPATETFVRNCGALYDRSEILLIDYGGAREYQLFTPGTQRLSAGRPEERGASPYRAPGRDDVTFLVDFYVAMNAAFDAGLETLHFAPQGKLAGLSGVRFGARAVDTIVAHHALAWLLAVSGVGPEQSQRSGAVSWHAPPGRADAKTVAEEAQDAIDEFLGRRESTFHLLLLRKQATRSSRRAGRPRARASSAGSRRSR